MGEWLAAVVGGLRLLCGTCDDQVLLDFMFLLHCANAEEVYDELRAEARHGRTVLAQAPHQLCFAELHRRSVVGVRAWRCQSGCRVQRAGRWRDLVAHAVGRARFVLQSAGGKVHAHVIIDNAGAPSGVRAAMSFTAQGMLCCLQTANATMPKLPRGAVRS